MTPARQRNGGQPPPDRKTFHAIYKHCRGEYDAALRSVYRQLCNLFRRQQINANPKHRVKSFDSYFDKLLRAQTHGVTPEITDMMGIRVICPFLEDIEHVERVIAQQMPVIELDRKRERQSFREFGYDSVHMMISLGESQLSQLIPFTQAIVEVQLRTILQEAWAEVEHEIVYKAEHSLLKTPARRKLASLNAMLDLSDTLFQELRDSQKELEQRSGRRRQTLRDKLADIDERLDLMRKVEPPKALELQVEDVSQNRLGKMLLDALSAHSAGQFDRAIDEYTAALRMKPEQDVRSILYNHRGMAYFVKSEYRKAIADFTHAIECNPDNFRALNHRGLCYRLAHQYERALNDFDCSLALNASQPETYYLRALVHYDLKDVICALEDCEHVLKLLPNFHPALQLKSLIGSY
ncbi:tetratricopeptide repeat protein [Candidatus Sumerlaeota bacterium]